MAKRTMNAVQTAYAKAMAKYSAAREIIKDMETRYIAENHIVNDDGKTPNYLWMMDDEKAFDVHNERFGKIVADSGMEKKENDAREELRKAEDALIAFGISLAPKNIQETLKKGGCGECQTSCQSACKTSCTVGNQSCESRK